MSTPESGQTSSQERVPTILVVASAESLPDIIAALADIHSQNQCIIGLLKNLPCRKGRRSPMPRERTFGIRAFGRPDHPGMGRKH